MNEQQPFFFVFLMQTEKHEIADNSDQSNKTSISLRRLSDKRLRIREIRQPSWFLSTVYSEGSA
jgi:hypothetical protein